MIGSTEIYKTAKFRLDCPTCVRTIGWTFLPSMDKKTCKRRCRCGRRWEFQIQPVSVCCGRVEEVECEIRRLEAAR